MKWLAIIILAYAMLFIAALAGQMLIAEIRDPGAALVDKTEEQRANLFTCRNEKVTQRGA